MTLHAIYTEHAATVWRILRRLGVSEADAADATQDVFLVVHKRLAEFRGDAKVTTWLFQICLRVASDRRKRDRRRREVLDDSSIDSVACERPDAQAGVERREGVRLLEAVLDTMSFDQRVVFTMFELEEMSGEVIAEALGVPVPTVHSRLRLGRQAFREALGRLSARERFEPVRAGGRP